MKNLFLLLGVACLSLQAAAQTNLDSLFTVWEDEMQADSIRADAYYKYLWDGYLFSNPDSAGILAQNLFRFGEEQSYEKAKAKACNILGNAKTRLGEYPQAIDDHQRGLKIYEGIGDMKGVADMLNNIGMACGKQRRYPDAMKYHNRSLEIRQKIGDKKGIASSLNNIGVIYKQQGDHPNALDHYQRSLKIKEEIGDQRGITSSLINIGRVYNDLKDFPKALEYLHRSLKITQEIGNPEGIATALENIGLVYDEQGDYTKALDYYNRSLLIEKEQGNKVGVAISLGNIGGVYSFLHDDTKAMEYFQQSMEISKEIGDAYLIAYLLFNIAVIHVDEGNYADGVKTYEEALDKANEIGALEFEQEISLELYKVYKRMENASKALEYHELYGVLNDSLFNEENTKKLTQLEMQFDFDKKEAATQAEQEKKDAVAAQELKRQKLVRNGFMGGFAVVFLFAGVFFFQRNRIGKEKERSEELLLNILPEETAQELKEKGHSDAQLIDHVTVLFTDFKGFTALSEQVTPKELVADLHECFSAFDKICEKYSIEKIKTIGDAYMAAGGLPTPNTTHAKDVAQAAIEMAKVVEEGKAKKQAANEPFFEIRIGVHTGPVVAGIVGVKKFQYDIWGDTVNTASRMESSGEVGKVNISEATYKLLKCMTSAKSVLLKG